MHHAASPLSAQALRAIGSELGFRAPLGMEGCFGGRLQVDSTTQISLQRYAGRFAEINGMLVDPGSGGFTLASSANLISSSGTDSGSGPSVSTLYYCYVSNSLASFAPLGIRLSATSPSLLNGAKYLAASGNGINWRFVGWVRMDGSTQFVSSTASRNVINYYNRLSLDLLATPAYTDDNSATTWTQAAGNWSAANGGTGSKITFVANGEDAVELVANAVASNGVGGNWEIGVGIDSTTTVTASSFSGTVTSVTAASAGWNNVLSEGYHTVDLLAKAGAATATFYADNGRAGSASDPRMTYLRAMIRG